MADIPDSTWNEADASNTSAAPDGWPEGMAPSGVNDTGRAMKGAIKRWYDWTIPKVTGGTSTAYTLSYSVAPGALVDGMTHLVQFNAVNGATPTLNINALGAKPLHFYCGGSWAALPANALAVDQVVEVTYNSAAGTYRCIGMPLVLTQSVSGVAAVDFTSIPSNVNDLQITFNLQPVTNAAQLAMQFYSSGGSLDTGANYAYANAFVSTSNTTSTLGAGGATGMLLTGTANSTRLAGGIINIYDIQRVAPTNATWSVNYFDSGGSLILSNAGGGQRTGTNGPLTGLRLVFNSGNITGGRVTVRASD